MTSHRPVKLHHCSLLVSVHFKTSNSLMQCVQLMLSSKRETGFRVQLCMIHIKLKHLKARRGRLLINVFMQMCSGGRCT